MASKPGPVPYSGTRTRAIGVREPGSGLRVALAVPGVKVA